MGPSLAPHSAPCLLFIRSAGIFCLCDEDPCPPNVVDLLLDAVCIVKADSSIVYVSPAFERIFGYAPEEVIGRRMLDMVHPEDRPATQSQAERVTEGQLQLHFENRYVRKDGQIVHIRWTARWVDDQQVRLAVAHDITERKHTESLQAAIYSISEAAQAAEDLVSLFAHIHQTIGTLLPASNFSVALHDHLDGGLRPVWCRRHGAHRQDEGEEQEEHATGHGCTRREGRAPGPAHGCARWRAPWPSPGSPAPTGWTAGICGPTRS